LGAVFENYKVCQIFATFFHGKTHVSFVTKQGWATFWATFSQSQFFFFFGPPQTLRQWEG
jgi:hypothetical protein